METVTLTMLDEITEKEVVRTIDISNVMMPNYNAELGWECNIIAPTEKQEALLERWINERGNKQHDTILTLKSWEIN